MCSLYFATCPSNQTAVTTTIIIIVIVMVMVIVVFSAHGAQFSSAVPALPTPRAEALHNVTKHLPDAIWKWGTGCV